MFSNGSEQGVGLSVQPKPELSIQGPYKPKFLDPKPSHLMPRLDCPSVSAETLNPKPLDPKP